MLPEIKFYQKSIRNEKTDLSATEQAMRDIEEHIGGAELGSARFQAFADYADHASAEVSLQKSPSNSIVQMEFSLINETIRQRKNGNTGYKMEFESAEKLGNKGSPPRGAGYSEQRELALLVELPVA
jgi:hypothetical protein